MTFLRIHVLVLVLGMSAVMAAPKVCTIKAFGKLTTFQSEEYAVEIPCRYRLAEMTCGVYSVKVTVRSDFQPPSNKRFSPEAVRVKISSGGEDYVAVSSVSQLERAANDLTGSTSPWRVVTSDLSPGFAGLEDGKAKVKKGPAVVTIGPDHTVEVTCNSNTFTGAPIDKALCGEMQENELQQWKKTQFGRGHGVSNAKAIHYLVLDNSAIGQSPICENLAQTFQACGEHKQQAVMMCEPLFGLISVARDLGQGNDTLLASYYESCLKFNCGC